MRVPWMLGPALVGIVSGSTLGADAPTFTKKPTATIAGGVVKVEFAVSAPTDVTVDIVDAAGHVVRHLAAGRLGPNAPAPLKPNSQEQSLVWDGKDDAGGGWWVVGGGLPNESVANRNPTPTTRHPQPLLVRVSLGLGAVLDRFIPSSSERITAPLGLGVGPNGDVYVLSGLGHESAYIYVLNRNGKYLRTILPPPASLKPEQLKGQERLTLADGTVVPLVFQANAAHLAPFLSGLRTQQLCVTQQGWICFASGGNDYSDQHVLRHVLVLNPDGSTPAEVGFVGPSLGPSSRYSIGLRPTQVAVSPDGQTIYTTGLGRDAAGRNPAQGIHAIGKTTWASTTYPEPFVGKPDEPGSSGEHLNDPVSLTCDAKGVVYVADAGNRRVAAFDALGTFLGETRTDTPAQVAVHPSGALYVLSVLTPWRPGRGNGSFALVKYDRAVGGREVARYAFTGRSATFALDPGAAPPKLWLGLDGRLLPVTDSGAQFAVGANLVSPTTFRSPLFLALDAAHDRLYVGDYSRTVSRVDLKTDQVAPGWMQACEPAIDRDGNVYVLSGYGTNALLRFTPEGKPLPFSATGSHKIDLTYRAGLPHVGVRGLTVAPSGDIYAWEDSLKTARMRLLRFAPDGRPKGEPIIAGVPGDSACGVAVDRAGNVYAGINVQDRQRLYPAAFADLIPPMAWERTYSAESGWYRSFPHRGVPSAPWNRMYLNYYLYHYGSIFKFASTGGTFWVGEKPPAAKGETPRPADVPADAREFATAFFKYAVWEKGTLWRYQGFALCSNRTESSGDPTCSCWTGRFGLDESGLLFVPDVFRFSVGVLDAHGNELTRFGAYGNVDSAGPKSAVPAPDIPVAWANTVAVGGGKVYLADRINRRIAVINLTYAATETAVIAP
jgi:DNA-binding beta-propeller fold protein YncE